MIIESESVRLFRFPGLLPADKRDCFYVQYLTFILIGYLLPLRDYVLFRRRNKGDQISEFLLIETGFQPLGH